MYIIMIWYLYTLWNNFQNKSWLRLLLQSLPWASHMSVSSRTQYHQDMRLRNLSCFQVQWLLPPDPSQHLCALSLILILWLKPPDCSAFSILELWLPIWFHRGLNLLSTWNTLWLPLKCLPIARSLHPGNKGLEPGTLRSTPKEAS